MALKMLSELGQGIDVHCEHFNKELGDVKKTYSMRKDSRAEPKD